MKEKHREVVDVRAELQKHPLGGEEWYPPIDWEVFDQFVDRVERIVYEGVRVPDLVGYELFCKNGLGIRSKVFTAGEDYEAVQLEQALEEMLYIVRCCLRWFIKEFERATGEPWDGKQW